MATKKAQVAATAPLASRALEHGARAFGARYLRSGWALTPELDLAFALGHGAAQFAPTVLLPDIDPSKLAKLKWQDAVVHRNVAIHVLRTGHSVWTQPVTAEASPATIEPDEAVGILKRLVPFAGIMPFGALEAMLGPSFMLSAFLDVLETLPTDERGPWYNNVLQVTWQVVHGLLLRVLPEEHAAARTRLDALLAARSDAHGARYLDISLHGPLGIVRRGYKYSREKRCYGADPGSDAPASQLDLTFLDGREDHVARSLGALWDAFEWKPAKWMIGPSSARLLFLGGEGALAHEARAVELYPKTMHADALASYSEMRTPSAARLVLALTRDGSGVQKQASAWLATHASWVRPLLEEWSRGIGSDADRAKRLL
jgi:hypothetical protein